MRYAIGMVCVALLAGVGTTYGKDDEDDEYIKIKVELKARVHFEPTEPKGGYVYFKDQKYLLDFNPGEISSTSKATAHSRAEGKRLTGKYVFIQGTLRVQEKGLPIVVVQQVKILPDPKDTKKE